MISNFISNLKPSPTVAITMKARAMKAEGKDIIELGAGEPDFDTPASIANAGKEAIDKGHTRYTPVDGTARLKKAIVKKLSRDNGLEFATDEISVGAGAKHTLFNLMAATINPADEVIIPAPYWVSYPDIVELFGGKSVVVQCGMKDDFKLTPEGLKSAITPKTKWLILNSPSNPTGSVYSREELLGLAKVLEENPHVHILSDDIYEYITYDAGFYNIASVSPSLIDRIFVLNGASKGYAMTGWRIGFGACKNKDIIKAIAKLQSQSTTNPCAISQEAAAFAFENDAEFVSEFVAKFRTRRDIFVKGLNSIDGISCNTPEGAFYCFFSIEGLIGKTFGGVTINSCIDFTDYLLENGVAVVPGVAFGTPNHIRVSYATSDSNIHEAVNRIAKALTL